jgi:hypothetical protein
MALNMRKPTNFNTKRIVNIFLLLLLIPNIFLSQQQFIKYYTNVNLAEHYFLNKQYDKSDSCYKIALTLDSIQGFNQDYLYAASNSKKIKTYLSLQNKAILDSIFFKDKILKKEMSIAHKKYKKILNKDVVSKIRRIVIRGQVARVGPVDILPWKIQRAIMIKVDKRNFKEFLLICKQYGWPGYNLIGEFRPWGKHSIKDADLIIRHLSKEELKEVEPYALEAIKKVNEYPVAWAEAIDYMHLRYPFYEDSVKWMYAQKYGTMFSLGRVFSKDTAIARKLVIWPFGKLENVNKVREELFLQPIEDYCKLWNNLLLPKEEKVIFFKNKRRKD